MSQLANHEFWAVFNARRVKAPELRGPDALVNSWVGFVKNRMPTLTALKRQVKRINALEPEIHNLSSAHFQEAVQECATLSRLGKLKNAALDRAMAIVREGCMRAIGKRPFDVQLMGALAMNQ